MMKIGYDFCYIDAQYIYLLLRYAKNKKINVDFTLQSNGTFTFEIKR